MSLPVHVWLVHGTFEPDAPWTDPERSPLCQSVHQALSTAPTFHRLRWSGRNRHADRVAAGDDLRHRILTMRGDNPDAVLAVVGHSHGGAVIAQALRAHPELGQALDAVVFLSTPFIHVVPRLHAVAVGAVAAFSGLLLLWSMTTVFNDGGLLATLAIPAGLHEALRWSLVATIAIGVLVWERVLGSPDAEQWLRARLDEVRREYVVEHLDPAKTLLIRAQADEASLVLTAVHALSRLMGEVVGRLAVTLTWFVPMLADRRAPTRARRGTDWLALPAAALFVAVIALAVVAMLWDAMTWIDQRLDISLRSPGPWATALLEQWERAAVWYHTPRPSFAAGIFIVGLVGTTLMLLLAAAFGVMGRAFGRWFFLPGLFLEMFVEPAPPGRWTMVQLSAPDQADLFASGGEVQLTHSISHSDPAAHTALADWLSRLVRQLDASVGIDPRSRNP